MAVLVAIPRVLREHLTDEGSEALVALLNETEEKNKQDIIQLAEERFERRLSEEIGKLRIEMHMLRSEMIKWMFIFWIGQFTSIVGVLTAILFAFFK